MNMLRSKRDGVGSLTERVGDFTQHITRLVFVPVLLLVFLSACGGGENGDAVDTLAADTTMMGADTTGQSIYDVIQDDSQFSQFATAVDSAGLTQTLSGPGPFTVFAPTNSAFQAMGGDNLLAEENRDRLRGVLLYHVSSGERMARDLQAGATVRTLEGSDLSIEGSGDSLRVGGARVTEQNIEAGNGVVHAIDKVLRPGSGSDGV